MRPNRHIRARIFTHVTVSDSEQAGAADTVAQANRGRLHLRPTHWDALPPGGQWGMAAGLRATLDRLGLLIVDEALLLINTQPRLEKKTERCCA